jgi:hypothetical protein
MTRTEWLNRLADRLLPMFYEAGYSVPIPDYFNYSIRWSDQPFTIEDNYSDLAPAIILPWTGVYHKARRLIAIMPGAIRGKNPDMHVAETLAHELCHMIVGDECITEEEEEDLTGDFDGEVLLYDGDGKLIPNSRDHYNYGHGPKFAKVARAIGLQPPWWGTKPGPRFKRAVLPLLAEIGPFPDKLPWE